MNLFVTLYSTPELNKYINGTIADSIEDITAMSNAFNEWSLSFMVFILIA